MCTVWHVHIYKIKFKLIINSRRTSRGPAVEKHWPIFKLEALQQSGQLFIPSELT